MFVLFEHLQQLCVCLCLGEMHSATLEQTDGRFQSVKEVTQYNSSFKNNFQNVQFTSSYAFNRLLIKVTIVVIRQCNYASIVMK